MRLGKPVFILVLLGFLQGPVLKAQWLEADRLSADWHQNRREELRQKLPPSSVAILFSNPVRNRSNDVDFQYKQDPDFEYLTGDLEANSVLFIFSSAVEFGTRTVNEIIVVQEKNPLYELWNGSLLGPDETEKRIGIQRAVPALQLEQVLSLVKQQKEIRIIYPLLPNDKASNEFDLGSMVKLVRESLAKFKPEPESKALRRDLNALREIKQPEEQVLMQKAIDLTLEGFREMMRCVEPGFKEYRAQAIVEYFMKRGGSEYQGYNSIVGGGANSCVLHYSFNRALLESGDLLLVDMGAEYHGYTADITRTFPVNGKFTEEQKQIYQLVLDAQEAGIAACLAGSPFNASQRASQEVIGKGLVRLGIITTENDFKKYFMHGTSHYLGLDVHDAGNYGTLKPGTIITVEPGIYIPKGSPCDPKWWNMGIRIEDDILVTETKAINLSKALVRQIDEIEKLMQENCSIP